MDRSSHKSEAENISLLGKLDRKSLTPQAALENLLRKYRCSHPDGEFDSAGRFYLSIKEHLKCCVDIRRLARSFPNSEMQHKGTITHVAAPFDVASPDVRRLTKRFEALATAPA